MQELQQRMQRCPAGTPDVATQRWFLRDRKLDVAEAADKLARMMEWRRRFMPRQLTAADVAAEAATGKAYLHEHADANGRPVIIVRAARHRTGARPLDDSCRLCAYLLEAAMAELPPGGETILGIFDLRDFGPGNADLGFVRFLVRVSVLLACMHACLLLAQHSHAACNLQVDAFFLYYPKRLGQVLFVDAPWAFKPGWEVVKPWLKKYAALVRFVSREEVRREYFKPGTCPADFR